MQAIWQSAVDPPNVQYTVDLGAQNQTNNQSIHHLMQDLGTICLISRGIDIVGTVV